MSRFKIGVDAAKLAADAKEWVAVLDHTTGLLWTVEEPEPMTFKEAQAYVKTLRTAGFDDWRLPTVEELFVLADRTRVSPAIDVGYFPDCRSDWYWTSTPAASSPGYAWVVYFGSGLSYWYRRGNGYCVRAVRASQS